MSNCEEADIHSGLAVTIVTRLEFCAACDFCGLCDSSDRKQTRRQVEGLMMRSTVIKMRAAILLAAAVILGLLSAQTASATTQMTATVGVNIRSGPSTNTAILGGLYRGQTVTAISSSQGWTKIKFGGSTAHVASKYLTKGSKLPAPSRIGSGTVKITTTALNLRTGPGLSYR
jgi:uncharacterized protein YraI